MPLKILFFGTPEFALPALETLNKHHQVLAVVTQPDKPAGRGMKLKPSAVKNYALENNLKIYQPNKLKSENEELENIAKTSDVMVCVAYGKIIPEKYLNIHQYGIINIHPSLLPRWRGAAPLQWTIFSGDKKTGVYLMKLDQGLDTGELFTNIEYKLKEDETLKTLHDTLSTKGARLLEDSIEKIVGSKIKSKAQAKENITYAEKWNKEDCKIKWQESNAEINRRIRASNPIPGAYAQYKNDIIKIFKALEINDLGYNQADPGEVVAINKEELIVKTGKETFLAIKEIQLPGKKRLSVEKVLQGFKFKIGDRFS